MVYNYELYELDESELIWLLSSVLGMYSNLWQGLENTMEIPWVPWMSGTSTKACPQHHFAEYTAWVLDVLGSRCSRWLRCTPSMKWHGMFGTFGMKMTRKHAGLIWRFWSIQRTVSFCCSAAEGQGSIQRDCHPNGQNTIASSLDSWWCLIWAENYTNGYPKSDGLPSFSPLKKQFGIVLGWILFWDPIWKMFLVKFHFLWNFIEPPF